MRAGRAAGAGAGANAAGGASAAVAAVVTTVVLAASLVGCVGPVASSSNEREKSVTTSRAIYLREAVIPSVARAGEPIAVVVRGDLPNPGWKFLKWDIARVEAGDGKPESWVVTPLIVYTLKPGDAVIQIIVPFEGSARIDAPAAPGAVDVEVRGFSAEERVRGTVEVVSANTLLDLRITGGFVGINDRVTIEEDGAIVASRSMDARRANGTLNADEMRAIRVAREAARIPDLSASYITENAADLFLYDLTDFGSDTPASVVADDMAMPASLVPLVALLKAKADAILGPVMR